MANSSDQRSEPEQRQSANDEVPPKLNGPGPFITHANSTVTAVLGGETGV